MVPGPAPISRILKTDFFLSSTSADLRLCIESKWDFFISLIVEWYSFMARFQKEANNLQ